MTCARMLVVVLALAGSLAVVAPAYAGPTQELVQRYAPVLMLKHNDDLPCGSGGERYEPMSVRAVLGNPRVRLIYAPSGSKRQVLKHAPTVADVAERSADYYLDEPGIPYRPGCRYARESRRLAASHPPVTYAHVVREPGRRGLAVQYWFFYWFNQFNDLHEADWEMIQLAFDASRPAAALQQAPVEVAYAQHGGGELASWDDDKLEKQGTHPVVYAASGSHASQYESAFYLGRGRQGSGLGCDDTRGPSYAVRPRPVIVPSLPTAPADRWLTYEGHWGQKARGFSNGVGGPNLKRQWRQPFTWMEGLRTSTPKVPVTSASGTTVTGFFCGAVVAVSDAANFVGGRNWVLGLVLLALVVAAGVPVWRTTWRPASDQPLPQRRAAGQLLRVAGRLYRRYALTLLALVGLVLGLAVLLSRAAQLLTDATGIQLGVDLLEPGVDGFVNAAVAAPAYPLVLAIVGAPLVALLRRIHDGERATPWDALREVLPRLPRLLLAVVLALGAITLLSATVIGIPYAVKKAVDWTFTSQEVVIERHGARAALAASSRKVRGRWWSVAAVDVVLFVVGAVVGPVVGTLLIVVTDAPIWMVNLFGLGVFGLALPFMVIALTLMWLAPRPEADTARARWSWRHPWRREHGEHVPAEAL